eukprot:Em0765g1a
MDVRLTLEGADTGLAGDIRVQTHVHGVRGEVGGHRPQGGTLLWGVSGTSALRCLAWAPGSVFRVGKETEVRHVDSLTSRDQAGGLAWTCAVAVATVVEMVVLVMFLQKKATMQTQLEAVLTISATTSLNPALLWDKSPLTPQVTSSNPTGHVTLCLGHVIQILSLEPNVLDLSLGTHDPLWEIQGRLQGAQATPPGSTDHTPREHRPHPQGAQATPQGAQATPLGNTGHSFGHSNAIAIPIASCVVPTRCPGPDIGGRSPGHAPQQRSPPEVDGPPHFPHPMDVNLDANVSSEPSNLPQRPQ